MPISELFSIDGRTAQVTGGSRGIGRMIATGFVEAGATVYVASRKAAVCEEVAAELSKIGRCIALPADLSTEEGCRRLAEAIAAREERLDILVNNAGATWGAPIEEFDEAAWERVLALNVKGVFHLTKFLLPLLRSAGLHPVLALERPDSLRRSTTLARHPSSHDPLAPAGLRRPRGRDGGHRAPRWRRCAAARRPK